MVVVIVRLEKEASKILTQHGKELHVPQHTVQKKNNRAAALDMNQVSLTMSSLYLTIFRIRILLEIYIVKVEHGCSSLGTEYACKAQNKNSNLSGGSRILKREASILCWQM